MRVFRKAQFLLSHQLIIWLGITSYCFSSADKCLHPSRGYKIGRILVTLCLLAHLLKCTTILITAGLPVTISCIWSTFELKKKGTILPNIAIETDVQLFITRNVQLQLQNLSKNNFATNLL